MRCRVRPAGKTAHTCICERIHPSQDGQSELRSRQADAARCAHKIVMRPLFRTAHSSHNDADRQRGTQNENGNAAGHAPLALVILLDAGPVRWLSDLALAGWFRPEWTSGLALWSGSLVWPCGLLPGRGQPITPWRPPLRHGGHDMAAICRTARRPPSRVKRPHCRRKWTRCLHLWTLSVDTLRQWTVDTDLHIVPWLQPDAGQQCDTTTCPGGRPGGQATRWPDVARQAGHRPSRGVHAMPVGIHIAAKTGQWTGVQWTGSSGQGLETMVRRATVPLESAAFSEHYPTTNDRVPRFTIHQPAVRMGLHAPIHGRQL